MFHCNGIAHGAHCTVSNVHMQIAGHDQIENKIKIDFR